MANLILLTLGDAEAISCTSLEDAKGRVISDNKRTRGAIVEITPEGGGPIHTLEFDFSYGDWVTCK